MSPPKTYQSFRDPGVSKVAALPQEQIRRDRLLESFGAQLIGVHIEDPRYGSKGRHNSQVPTITQPNL